MIELEPLNFIILNVFTCNIFTDKKKKYPCQLVLEPRVQKNM